MLDFGGAVWEVIGSGAWGATGWGGEEEIVGGARGGGSWGHGAGLRACRAGRGLHKCSLAPNEAAESGCLILSGNTASHTLAQAAGLGGDSMFPQRSHRGGRSMGPPLAEPRPSAPSPAPWLPSLPPSSPVRCSWAR